MSYTEEFEQQWKSISNLIQNEMTKQQKSGTVDVEQLQNTLENEKQRYSLAGQYHYAWLEKLRREKPDIAENFENALNAAKLEQTATPQGNQNTGILIPALAGCGIGIGLIVTKLLLHFTLLPVVLGTAFLGVGGGVAGKNISDQKKEEADHAEQQGYIEQMSAIGKALSDIVKKADEFS